MAATTLDGSVTPFVIPVGTTYQVNNGDSASLLGSIDNIGTLFIDSTGTFTAALVDSTLVTLFGGGTLLMSTAPAGGTASNTVAHFNSGPPFTTDTLDNVDNTIAGYGNLNLFSLSLTNETAGIIDATGPAGQGLLINGNKAFVNRGLLEVTVPGGGLSISGIAVDQASGTILASGAGAVVALGGSTIRGGLLETALGGVIDGTLGTLDGRGSAVTITAGSTVEFGSGFTSDIAGVIVNRGLIVNTAYIVTLGSSATLTGAGVVQLSGGYFAGGGALVNVDNTITGGGLFGYGGVNQTFSNLAAGTVDATRGMAIYAGTSTVVNQGLIEAVAGGGFAVESAGTFDNTGGTLLADAAQIRFSAIRR